MSRGIFEKYVDAIDAACDWANEQPFLSKAPHTWSPTARRLYVLTFPVSGPLRIAAHVAVSVGGIAAVVILWLASIPIGIVLGAASVWRGRPFSEGSGIDV